MASKAKRSDVWVHFEKLSGFNTVKCKLCCKILKSSGNTSNLKAHINQKHNNNINNNNTIERPAAVSSGSSSVHVLSSSRVEEELVDDPSTESLLPTSQQPGPQVPQQPGPQVPQPTLVQYLQKTAEYADGGVRNKRITETLLYMVCKDNLPLSCVEKEGFREFVKELNPKVKLPSRYKLTALLEQKYTTEKNALKQHLKDSDVALTSDILTLTNSTRSFLVLTLHFLNAKEKELESVTLSARWFSETHTAANIVDIWKEILGEFGILHSQIVGITTDGGSNMIAAANSFLGHQKRLPCYAHTLNLIVEGSISSVGVELTALIAKIKGIVTYFKHSVQATEELRKEQISSGIKEGDVLMLIQSVSTRWNSTLDMLDRFGDLARFVVKILLTRSGAPDMIPSTELNVIREIVKLLQPFKKATAEISGSTYVTASLVIPLSQIILKNLESVEASGLTSSLAIRFASSLIEEAGRRFRDLEKNSSLVRAMLLDPRFKKISLLIPTLLASNINAISKLINDERFSSSKQQNAATGGAAQQSQEQVQRIEPDNIWSGRDALIRAPGVLTQDGSGSMPSELKQYFDQPVLPMDTNPLEYWLGCRIFTPFLANIALKSLLPQGSSVSSERVASTVNLVVPNNRSRLTGEHVEMRVFLTSLPKKYWTKLTK